MSRRGNDTMKIINHKDFWAGVLFLAFGAFFAGEGASYTFGSAARMGPGYFPTILGMLLMLFGLIVAVGGMRAGASPETVDRFSWPTLALILGPIVLFGLLLEPLGLILSLLMLVGISSYASHEFSWRGALYNAAFLIGLCLLVFIYALGLQFQLWPSFVGV